jgi:hypothetical protein
MDGMMSFVRWKGVPLNECTEAALDECERYCERVCHEWAALPAERRTVVGMENMIRSETVADSVWYEREARASGRRHSAMMVPRVEVRKR